MAKQNPVEFLRQVRQETSKVTWPTRRETIVSFIMVLIMVVLFSLFFFVVDQIFSFSIRAILGLGG